MKRVYLFRSLINKRSYCSRIEKIRFSIPFIILSICCIGITSKWAQAFPQTSPQAFTIEKGKTGTVQKSKTADLADKTSLQWKKTVIDTAFRSEGVAIGDINGDGKMDIIAGEVWYEAPSWQMHPFRATKNYRDGEKNVYSNSFACWTEDINHDGKLDIIVIGFPGAPCYWYENPGFAASGNSTGPDKHWPAHLIWHSACNETPLYADLFGKGQRVLIMGWQPKGQENQGQMAWFSPDKDVTKPWIMHPISEASTPPSEKDGKKIPGKVVPGTFRFSHGLGVGDVNGDGRNDILIPEGWWEQPTDAKTSPSTWKFHSAPLGAACADMFALDLDGDGKKDVVSSSAHGYGIWSYLQKSKEGQPSTFLKKDLFPRLVSQTHALHLADINGDGLPDLITGKRWWAHGPKGDADPNAPPKIYWFEAKKQDGIISFTPHEIDNDSGIGTQFVVADFNGDKLLDIVVANKKGVFLIEQIPAK